MEKLADLKISYRPVNKHYDRASGHTRNMSFWELDVGFPLIALMVHIFLFIVRENCLKSIYANTDKEREKTRGKFKNMKKTSVMSVFHDSFIKS